MPNEPAPVPSSHRDVDAFLAQRRQQRQVARVGSGRLMFGADATMSREPTVDFGLPPARTCLRRSRRSAGSRSSLSTISAPDGFQGLALGIGRHGARRVDGEIECASGYTQFAKVLAHLRAEPWYRRSARSCSSATPSRNSCCPLHPCRWARRAVFHVFGRRRPARGRGVPGDRAPDQRRLCPLRLRGGRSAAGRRGVCGGRPESGFGEPQCRRRQAAPAAQ